MSMTEGGTMAKSKGRPQRSGRDDTTAKLDRALVGMAKLIATRRGIPVAELLSDLLRGPLEREYAKMLRELEEGGGR
jgi:hypothetical protein